jgi:hypothetical protein
MKTRRAPEGRSHRAAAAGSWLALLAAATIGDAAGTVHAEVRAEGLRDGAYRLTVQSYDQTHGRVPGAAERPVGSVQRAVTAEELRRGVHVDLLELRAAQVRAGSPTVVAWIEPGSPDLEFDGRAARPRPGSVFGVARRGTHQSAVTISLDRKVAV